MRRRTFLAIAGTSATVVLAGCNDEEAPPDDTDDTTVDDADDTVDDDDDDATEPDDDTVADDDADDTADDEQDDDPNDNPRLRDVLNWESSFAMDIEFEEGSGYAEVYDEDFYMTWTAEGETIESYRVDNQWYTVMGEECFTQPMEDPDDHLVDPDDPIDDDEEYIASGQTEVEGEDVWEFEMDEGTLYVSVETGYPVRFDADDGEGHVIYHSWGEVEPISPPDMECVDPGEDMS